MSFIISFITDDFVSIAADRRTTTRTALGDKYTDNSNKITKTKNYIYAASGHVEQIKHYESKLNAKTFNEIENYTDTYFKKLDIDRQNDNILLEKLKLQIHICSNDRLIVYMIFPGEEEVLKADVPKKAQLPSFSAPNIKDEEITLIEKYIKDNYPQSIIEAKKLSEDVIKKVSKSDATVSEQYDFEYLVNF